MKGKNVTRWYLVVALASLIVASTGASKVGQATETGKVEGRKKALVFTGKGRDRDRDEKAALRKATEAAKADALEKARDYLVTTKIKNNYLRYLVSRYVNEKLVPDQCFQKFQVIKVK